MSVLTPSQVFSKRTTKQDQSFFPLIEPHLFSQAVKKMRLFFEQKGFLEVHTQNRLSIMAACEDPFNIATYNYAGEVWPLPQTGQMWLEYELLNKPDVPGYYCVSTSFRNEQNPVPGRHCLIFPMFEFEMHGGLEAMIELEKDFLEFLGFGDRDSFPMGDYEQVAAAYGVKELEREHETQLAEDHGAIFFLNNFPEYTSPFWNMKRKEGRPDLANKVDVIMHGQETIGSAERSCNKEEMSHTFHTIENGAYAQKLYDLFGEDRVKAELEDFLSYDFFPRSGGGIGVTRMIRAMQLSNIIS